jgi:hypothetical protein
LDSGNFYLVINCYLSIFQTNADNDDDDVCSVSSAEAGNAPSHSSESDQRCVGKSLSLPMPKKTDVHFPAPSVPNKTLKRKSNSDQVDEAYKFMRTSKNKLHKKMPTQCMGKMWQIECVMQDEVDVLYVSLKTR